VYIVIEMSFLGVNLLYFILASGYQEAEEAATHKGQRPKEKENLPKIHR
jgi:hypothetical protein